MHTKTMNYIPYFALYKIYVFVWTHLRVMNLTPIYLFLSENLFKSRTYLNELAVSCDQGPVSDSDHYPAETWTCINMTSV